MVKRAANRAVKRPAKPRVKSAVPKAVLGELKSPVPFEDVLARVCAATATLQKKS